MELRNFWSFLGTHTFDIADDKGGLFFLRGRNLIEPDLEANDAGKSTLLRAFMWCLFGRTQEGLLTPDIKPWNPGKHKDTTSVVVPVWRDGKKHVVERRAESNGLYLDGKSCGQEDVLKLLQMNDVLCQHTILLGQGEPLFFDLTPAKKMELFVEALALERWDVRSTHAGDEVKRLEKDLAAVSAKLEILKASGKSLTSRAADAKAEADNWAASHKEELNGRFNLLEEAERELKKQQKLLDTADLAQDGTGTEIKALRNEKEQLQQQLNAANMQAANGQIKLTSNKNRHRELTGDLEKLTKEKACPTCGQPIKKAADLDRHKKEIAAQLENLEKLITDYKRIVNTGNKEAATFQRALDLLNTRLREFEAKEDTAQSTRNRLIPVVAKLKATIEEHKKAIEELESRTNVFKKIYKDLQQELADNKAEIAKQTKEADRINSLIERSRPWVKGFKDIRLYIMREVFKELEFVTNGMLPDFGLSGWNVQYDIERETRAGTMQRGLNVSVLSPRNKKPVKWKCWGGGVAQRLRVVGALALSETLLTHAGISCNLEILDEPASHMTKGGIRDLCDYLAWRAAEQQKTIWFIDHMSVESDRFTDVATVVKDEDGSHLVWG